MRPVLVIALLLVLTMNVANAGYGSVNCKVWSPPDKSFKVDVPVKLQEVKGEYDDLSREKYESIQLFGSSEKDSTDRGMTFQIVILQLTEKARRSSANKLQGLEFLIGGDEDKPTRDSGVKIDGLNARELLYSSSTSCRKGLIVDAGNRIYVLGLAVTACEGLNSSVAKRFFESFRITRRK